MNPEVKRRWIAWSSAFEGRIAWMYLDVRGLVTTGVGNLIDPVEYALTLPWRRRSDGRTASQAEIGAEWGHMKAQTRLAKDGAVAAGHIATLELSASAIDAMVLAKLDSNDRVLREQFSDWDRLPWQAQMAIHSMAWAMGPRFGYPHFRDAIRRRDWITAATECTIGEAGNPGVIARNKANRELLIQAAGQQAPAQSVPPGPAVRAPTPAQDSPASPAAPARGRWDWLEAFVAWLFRKKPS